MNIEDQYEAVVVCGHADKAPKLPDNVYGNCGLCGCAIVWRPHSPSGDGVLSVCPSCGLEQMMDMGKRGAEYEVVVTKKTSEEVEAATGVKIEPTEK